jgi:hypothetical protein
MREDIRFAISDEVLMDMNCHVPVSVQIRKLLNKEGFKFEDDGNVSSIVNEEPKPLGVIDTWYDIENRVTHYRQTINQP